MPLVGLCGKHSTEGVWRRRAKSPPPGRRGSGGVQNDDPDPAQASRGSAGSRGSAPGERQIEQRPHGAGVRSG